MRLSIIIPAYNEQDYLPVLLTSLRQQSFKDFEIIVSDAGSRDNTVKIARKAMARIVKGGGPARGRNAGATRAKGEFLLFLDADTKLPKDFLARAMREIDSRMLDVATCRLRPLSNMKVDKLMHEFANTIIRASQYTDDPLASGCCIFVTKRLFDRIAGFDESLTTSEDHDFVRRASKFRPVRVLKTTSLFVSVRRLRKEGRANLIIKYAKVALYKKLGADLSKEIIRYEFGDYEASPRAEKAIMHLERELRRISKGLERAKNSPIFRR